MRASLLLGLMRAPQSGTREEKEPIESRRSAARQKRKGAALWARVGLAGAVYALGVFGCAPLVSDALLGCADETNLESQITSCSRAIRSGQLTDEALTLALNCRGNAYRETGRYDEAIKDFDRVLRLSPRDAGALTNRGLAYAGKGDDDRAVQDYTEALGPSLDYAPAFVNRGYARMRRGDYTRAVMDFEEALRLDVTLFGAFMGRGWARFFQGQFAPAAGDFARVVELRPTDLPWPLWLYLARRRAGEEGRAELAESARRLDLSRWPGPVVALFLGHATPEAVLSSAEHSDAKKTLEQRCEAYFFLGELALLQGERSEAVRLFQAVLATRVRDFMEYHAAQVELRRLPP